MGMTLQLLRVSAPELDAYLENSALLADRVQQAQAAGDTALYDIDKSWDGIIYLLTGSTSSDTAQPLSQLFFSGRLVDPAQDLGTGPAHYLRPEEVQALYAQIKDIIPAALKNNFDAVLMKEVGVYPGNVWDQDETDDYLVEYFETVQELFATAGARGEAVITFVQ